MCMCQEDDIHPHQFDDALMSVCVSQWPAHVVMAYIYDRHRWLFLAYVPSLFILLNIATSSDTFWSEFLIHPACPALARTRLSLQSKLMKQETKVWNTLVLFVNGGIGLSCEHCCSVPWWRSLSRPDWLPCPLRWRRRPILS